MMYLYVNIKQSGLEAFDYTKAVGIATSNALHAKIQTLAQKVFALIESVFLRAKDALIDLFCPYELATNQPIGEDELGINTVTTTIRNGLDQSLTIPDNTDVQEKCVALGNVPTYTYMMISHVIMPTLVGWQNFDQGAISSFITASNVQQKLHTNFERALNTDLLKTYQLDPAIDETGFLDRLAYHVGFSGETSPDENWTGLERNLYQAGLLGTGSVLSKLTSASVDQPLYTALTVLATLPPVQKKVMEHRFIKPINQTIINGARALRECAKKPIVFFLKRKTIQGYVKLLGFLELGNAPRQDTSTNHVQPENEGSRAPQTWQDRAMETGLAIGTRLGKNFIKKEVCKRTEKGIARVTDYVTDAIAGEIVDQSVNLVKGTAQFYYFNKMLSTTLQSSPLLGSVVLISSAGINPTQQQLALRITGAVVMVLTGSTLLPLAIVYAPPTIDYLVWLHGDYTKKPGWYDTSVLDTVIQTTKSCVEIANHCFSSLGSLMFSKTEGVNHNPINAQLLQIQEPLGNISVTSINEIGEELDEESSLVLTDNEEESDYEFFDWEDGEEEGWFSYLTDLLVPG